MDKSLMLLFLNSPLVDQNATEQCKKKTSFLSLIKKMLGINKRTESKCKRIESKKTRFEDVMADRDRLLAEREELRIQLAILLHKLNMPSERYYHQIRLIHLINFFFHSKQVATKWLNEWR